MGREAWRACPEPAGGDRRFALDGTSFWVKRRFSAAVKYQNRRALALGVSARKRFVGTAAPANRRGLIQCYHSHPNLCGSETGATWIGRSGLNGSSEAFC